MRVVVRHSVRAARIPAVPAAAMGTSASVRPAVEARKPVAVLHEPEQGMTRTGPVVVSAAAVLRGLVGAVRRTGFPHRPFSAPPGYGRRFPSACLPEPAPLPVSARSGLRNIFGRLPPRRSFSTASPFFPAFPGLLLILFPVPSSPACFLRTPLPPAARMFQDWPGHPLSG